MSRREGVLDGTPVPLHEAPLVGRERERARLLCALAGGRFPQNLLLSGAAGTGKRRLALWTAQALLCEASGEEGPCDRCPSCQQVKKLAHPDLHIYLPHDSPGEGSEDSQIAHITKARSEALEAMRADALFARSPGGAYYAATARAIGREVQSRSVAGGRRVVLLLDAERLMPHAGATEASNALLKVLEEPPSGTHFLLTAPARHTLLPTLTSRMTEMRLAPLRPAEMEEILRQARPGLSVAEPEVRRALGQAAGSMSEVRNWLDPEWQKGREQALALLRTGLSARASERYAQVGEQGFKGARGEFSELLRHLETLSSQAVTLLTYGREAVERVDPRLVEMLRAHSAGSASHEVRHWAAVMQRVMEGRAQASGNAGPMLVLHRILREMSERFAPPSRTVQSR